MGKKCVHALIYIVGLYSSDGGVICVNVALVDVEMAPGVAGVAGVVRGACEGWRPQQKQKCL